MVVTNSLGWAFAVDESRHLSYQGRQDAHTMVTMTDGHDSLLLQLKVVYDECSVQL